MRGISLLILALSLVGCGDSPPAATDGGLRDLGATDGPRTDAPVIDLGPHDAGSAPLSVAERAREVAADLRGGTPHFLIGLGGSDDAAYTLGVTMDLHYVYLVGFSDAGGWTTWNPGGSYVDIVANASHAAGTTPMFTYYAMALEYEQGRDSLRDAARMDVYLSDLKLMFTRLGALGFPAVVHIEPDFFGYMQQKMVTDSLTPDTYDVALQTSNFHDCDALPQTAHGWIQCILQLRDANAPLLKVGFAASAWGDSYDAMDPTAPIEAKAQSHAAFLSAMGADQADLVVVEALDRDAGYWETHKVVETPVGSGNWVLTTIPCSVDSGQRGRVYWDEANVALPNFSQHLRWVSALTTALTLPALWWQLPLGVPSATCGGSDHAYRDNRVHYFFAHPDELIAAGGLGAAWGTGADLQTYVDSDGNQFRDAVTAYYAAPIALP
jgi:hypothetical protein